MESTTIVISTAVKADVSKAWEYYTHPDHITKWNFADESWHCPSASNDLRPGGRYVARMEARDGSMGFDFEAVYDAVQLHRRIEYTIADGRKVRVEFSAIENRTEVRISFEAENIHPVELQRDGWQAILNNFGNYTERN
jgi:uncharacterized protein YndB with AHSA1/START domain